MRTSSNLDDGTCSAEIARGDRFAFGQNWRAFLCAVDEERIERAAASLREFIGWRDLRGLRFLDIGSGSGLFSLAARRLGAKVRSIDFDLDSVACARTLRQRYCGEDEHWVIERGSVLDPTTLPQARSVDIVYSWGVLHHTGQMWQAVANAANCVAPGGLLYLSIYNDQGWRSRVWHAIKRLYNALPPFLRGALLIPCALRLWGPTVLRDAAAGRPLRSWRSYSSDSLRGMDPWRDLIDWVGGLPFEVARPEQVLDRLRPLDFSLLRLRTCGGGLGCNEYLLRRGGLR